MWAQATYPAWYFFHINKRVHRNDFEHIVTLIPLSLVNGLVYPVLTIGLLSLYAAGRYAFTYGYLEKEGALNKYRVAGSVAVNVSKLLTMGTFAFLGLQMVRGRPVLQKALSLI